MTERGITLVVPCRCRGSLRAAPMTSRACGSLDHLIGPRQQRRRDGEAERFRGLEVDDELELRRSLDGEVARLRATEYPIDVTRQLVPHRQEVGAVGHQAAVIGKCREPA